MRGWHDVVTEHHAKGDGTTDDRGAIQAAVNAAIAQGGGIVWLPPGTYRLKGMITIPNQVQLVGAGWGKTWTEGGPNFGTWLRISDPGFSAIEIGGAGTLIKDIAFYYDQPPFDDDWNPNFGYLHAIHVIADDVFLEGIHLFNPTFGVLIHYPDGVNTIGRTSLNRIWGQPLAEGIRIENVTDVVKVNNVHFWRFWSSSVPNGEFANVYQANHGVAICCFNRCDNPQFSNIFALGYSTGIQFEKHDQKHDEPTSKFVIANADLDFCATAIKVKGAQTTGHIVNLNSQAGVCGISLEAPAARIQATNIRLRGYTTNAIQTRGSCALHLSNIWIQDWNIGHREDGLQFPGIEVTEHSSVSIARPALFEQGDEAPHKPILKSPHTRGNVTIFCDDPHEREFEFLAVHLRQISDAALWVKWFVVLNLVGLVAVFVANMLSRR